MNNILLRHATSARLEARRRVYVAHSAPRAGRSIVALGTGCALALGALPVAAQGDLYIKDAPADTGVEPNPDGGPMWVSEDIWVRNAPDPNYDPRPYPTGSPTWTPAAHQNPEFNDPKYGFPSYIYVRIHNRSSTQASSGNERLRVYWAKASTGLGWPTQWVDYIDNTCGSDELYGMEVTKPRKNAALASPSERNAYIAALLDIDSNAALQFSDGTPYWDKQNDIHSFGGALHGVPGFLPWHREYLNRLETLMRESDPALTLMYWDWTTDPRTGFGTNLFTTSFMGASSGTVGAPLAPLAPPTLSRDIGFFSFAPHSDGAIAGETNFPDMADRLEGTPNHNSAHGYIGGPGGNISGLSAAAQDPFFFFLHGNADKIWAQWQRDPNHPERLDNATAYGTDAGHTSITDTMSPWDGGTSVSPWTSPSEQANKACTHYSVVAPPVYDTAPLRIPVLDPGESCVVQIPWFPPNPALFNCFGDPGHFCLLARIETSDTFPFGMTFGEGTNVSTNTRNNNNIAWKNLTVVDNFSRLRFLSAAILRNILLDPHIFRLNFRVPPRDENRSLFDRGRVTLLAPREFVEIWEKNNQAGEGVTIGQTLPDGTVELLLAGNNTFMEVPLDPGESFPIGIRFDLREPIQDDDEGGPYHWDIEQVLPGEPPFIPETVVGGQRFAIDLSKFRLIGTESEWAYHDGGRDLGAEWSKPGFDDSEWRRGRAPLGFGNAPRTVVEGGPSDKRHPTVYFRRRFGTDDPGFYNRFRLRVCHDDGFVAYLNGEEIARRNMPDGPPDYGTLAVSDVSGVEECVYWEIPLGDVLPLRDGENLLAVEVHQASPESDDLHFDLEFCANQTPDNIKPAVKILRPLAGTGFAPGTQVVVEAEALDQDGKLREVRLLVDGQERGADREPPYQFQLEDLQPGSHLLTAVAVDDQDAECTHSVRITVAEQIPPLPAIVTPTCGKVRCTCDINAGNGTRFLAGTPIAVRVEILSAPSGPVEKVGLYMRDGDAFSEGFNLVADGELVDTDDAPPYEFEIPGLPPGRHILQASATDAAGNEGRSNHICVTVLEDPFVRAERQGASVVITWGPEGTRLERSASLEEPWTPVQGATSPLVLPIENLTPADQYYRAVLDLGVPNP